MKATNITVEPYTDEELIKLETCIMNTKQYACNTAGEFLRLRDLTILKLGAIAGMRISEVLHLKWSDIDLKQGMVYLIPYSNKERNAEPIVLNDVAISIFKSWKEIFSQYLVCAYCFPSLFTFEPITSCAYRKRLLFVSREAGVGRDVWVTEAGQPIRNKRFNSARKYFATEIMLKKKDPYLVLRALRQTSLRSVQQYANYSSEHIRNEENDVFANDKPLPP